MSGKFILVHRTQVEITEFWPLLLEQLIEPVSTDKGYS